MTQFIAHIRSHAAKLRALPENFRWIVVWPMMAVVVVALGWSILLAALDNKRREVDNEALRQAAALSRNYAGQLDRMIDGIDQILLHVKYEWELSQGLLRLENVSGRGLFPPASDLNVAILDRHGTLLTSTGAHTANVKGAHRPAFSVHQSSNLDVLYVDMSAADGMAGPRIMYLSRKLSTTTGSFHGVVMVSVIPEYFTASYDETTLGANGFIGMVGADGRVGATRIGSGRHAAAAQTLLTAPHVIFKTGSAVFHGSRWFADQRSRYVGWQTLDAYPMIAMVGLDEQDFLASYRAYRGFSIRYAVLATLALFVATVLGTVLAVRLSARRRQLELTQAAYRMATDEGIEGFYIVRPVRDRCGAIVDFKVIDCNSRGAELFNLSRNALIGKAVSAFDQGIQPAQLIRGLHTAMAAGTFESELEVPGAGLASRWLRLKIVRSNDNLAIRLSDISESKAHVAELERRGNEDALTGLPNRHWVNLYLPQAVERAAANHAMLALLFIDLDGFKDVNDTFGHEAGDELLRNAGRRLKLAVRPGDHVVRIGGDEFVVILEEIAHPTDAAHVAERVVAAFHKAFGFPQGVQTVGASIGISVFPRDGTDADTLLRNADIAMYAVKTSGKRNYRFYDEKLYERLRARMEREAELRHAIDHDQFVMYYQPRVDISTGTTSSMEALVRWAHPAKGIIGPLEFIPLAEETGFILELGRLIIDKVCAQLAAWAAVGQELVPVSINVSPRQFNEMDISKILLQSLARHRVNPNLVEIELTESSMMGDNLDISATLDAIQQMGVKLLVDDFGTGYSSLSQLQRLDFDVLKVDQAFTARLEKTEEGNVFFKAIITMAHALGMRVVAEGVETFEQIRILKTLQCDEIQGFYISQPLPPSDTQPILPKWFFPSTA